MLQITFLQLVLQAKTLGADTAIRKDGVPMFLVDQFDGQPEENRNMLSLKLTNSSLVTFGDLMCALLMASLALSGVQTEDFFNQALKL